MRIFKCAEDENTIPLHSRHHAHVQQSLEYFKEDIQAQTVETITRKSLNPAENKAISNIQMIIGASPTAQKKAVLGATIDMIKSGGIKGLSRDINDYFKTHSLKDIPSFIDELFREVLDNYKIKTGSVKDVTADRVVRKPYIVLSESFSE